MPDNLEKWLDKHLLLIWGIYCKESVVLDGTFDWIYGMATGHLSHISLEVKHEWKIKDFLLLPHQKCERHASPVFSFSGSSWRIEINPSDFSFSREGWMSLFIQRLSCDFSFNLNYAFSLKTVEGKSVFDKTGTIDKDSDGWGFRMLISRSELIQRKSELLPSGVLTVICTLKCDDSTWKEIACVDAWAQTDPKLGKEDGCVDEFSKTAQETGVWKLQQNFKEILLSGIASDVLLKVNDQEFKSHWCILAARSPVFLAMTTHDTKEKNSGVVDIPDADPNTFSDFLNYLYTANVDNVTSENVSKLYIVADKYQVVELKESCLHFMLKNITVDSFCDFLTLSLHYVEKELTDACSQFFIENALSIILTPKWQAFLSENPVAGNELHIKMLQLKK